MKTTVIYHSADMDGLFCREIAKKFLPPETEFIGWDFKDAPLAPIKDGQLYILDLPCDRPFGFDFNKPETFSGESSFSRLIWIDHHKTSIDSHPPGISGYRIDGVAACRLAWQWFLKEETVKASNGGLTGLPDKQAFVDHWVKEPLAVRLAGEYDIWDKRDPDAETFQFGLRSRELTDISWKYLLGDDRKAAEQCVGDLLERGLILQQYQQRSDAGTMSRSFLVKFEGLTFLALNTARCNSLTFASKDIPETGHDALAGFYFDGTKWNVSLYHARHNMGIDLSEIAKKHGGGGHRGACGFTARNMPFTIAFDFDK